MIDLPEVEGIGSEVLVFGIIATAIILLYFAWRSTGVAPLNYDLFLVEMQTYPHIRLVQVLHIGYEEVRQFGGDLIQRLREVSRRHRPSLNNVRPTAVSDTNVVIQSPATVLEGDAVFPEPTGDMRLWELEMPILNAENARYLSDSDLAAAAAVTVVSGRMSVSTTSSIVNMGHITEIPLDGSMSSPSLGNVRPIPISSNVVVPPVLSSPTTEGEVNEGIVDAISEDSHYAESATPAPTSIITPPGPAGDSLLGVPVKKTDSESENISKCDSVNESGPETLIRLKFLDDTQKTTSTYLTTTIGCFKRKYFAEDLAAGKVIRLIFRGQLLRDDSRTLESYGLHHECVVHCHVSKTPYAQPIGGAVPSTNQSELRQRTAGREASTTGMGVQSDPQNTISPETNILARIFVAIMASFSSLNASFSLFSGFVRGFASPLTSTQQAPQTNSGFFRNTYRRIHNGIFAAYSSWDTATNGLDAAADAASQRAPQALCLGDFLLWIFAVQFACVWSFVYFFPQLCDRVAFSLLVLLTLYFVFVVYRNRRIDSDRSSQQRSQGTTA